MGDDTKHGPVTLTSADGVKLDARVDAPTAEPWLGVAAIAHPHPQYGGDMDNNVVRALQRGLNDAGVATVRFDFRGVGRSGGVRGGGPGVRLDVDAALEHAASLDTTVPLYVCGYSFGAGVALTCTHDRAAAWIVVAPALQSFEDDEYAAATDARPKHIITGVHDAHASPSVVRALTAGWRNVHIYEVEMTDHFFAGREAALATLARGLVTDER